MRLSGQHRIIIGIVVPSLVGPCVTTTTGVQEVRTEDQMFTATVVGETDYFGWDIATDGSTALVGVVYDDQEDFTNCANSGSVDVFERDGPSWAQVARLVAHDELNSVYVGAAVAMSGDTAVIGTLGREGKTGAADVFVRDAGVSTEQQRLIASDAAEYDGLGFAVPDGDTVVVGAELSSPSDVYRAGSAYVSRTGGDQPRPYVTSRMPVSG